MIVCSVSGCSEPIHCRGWCSRHYYRWYTHGNTFPHIPFGITNSLHRPKTVDAALCIECKRMRPRNEFPPSRSRCRDCYRKHRQGQARTRSRAHCPECGGDMHIDSELCKRCAPKTRKKGPDESARHLTARGYVMLGGYHGHPNARKNGRILEHTLVMSQILGRPLYPCENVHHKNGVRDDNRPENLELWITSQPSGQRPRDLLAWARQIIDRYADMENVA